MTKYWVRSIRVLLIAKLRSLPNWVHQPYENISVAPTTKSPHFLLNVYNYTNKRSRKMFHPSKVVMIDFQHCWMEILEIKIQIHFQFLTVKPLANNPKKNTSW